MPGEVVTTRYEPATPDNAVVLVIDQQDGWFGRIHEPDQTLRALLVLLRGAQLLDVPMVFTTNMAAGPNGQQLSEIAEIVAEEVIDRTAINAWHESRVRNAVKRTGRRKLIIAGTGLDVCAQLLALSATADGYDTGVVIDACGIFEPQPSLATVTRLSNAGVATTTSSVIVLEMMADNSHPRAGDIYGVLFG